MDPFAPPPSLVCLKISMSCSCCSSHVCTWDPTQRRSRIAGGATHLCGEDARSSATPSLPPGPINDSSPPVNSICNKFNSVVSCGANEGGGRAEESKRDRSNMLT
uniref:Uncharacterized protein n=1 Tax=Lotharella globosa TaxID=91324 RepID=A0A7S3YX40_9EUKA